MAVFRAIITEEFTHYFGLDHLVGTVKALTGEIEVAAKITIESGKTTTKP